MLGTYQKSRSLASRIDFGSILGSKLGPCWPLFRQRTLPRPTKKPCKIIPNAQDNPKCIPDPSRTPRDLDFVAPEPRFWVFRTSILVPLDLDVWTIWGLLLCYFASRLLPLLHRKSKGRKVGRSESLCYIVALLLCYFATLLLCSWRGGGDRSFAALWIHSVDGMSICVSLGP